MLYATMWKKFLYEYVKSWFYATMVSYASMRIIFHASMLSFSGMRVWTILFHASMFADYMRVWKILLHASMYVNYILCEYVWNISMRLCYLSVHASMLVFLSCMRVWVKKKFYASMVAFLLCEYVTKCVMRVCVISNMRVWLILFHASMQIHASMYLVFRSCDFMRLWYIYFSCEYDFF